MGKKAIKRIVVIWFAGLATFSVLANDLLPVSAPILAVGRSAEKQQAGPQTSVTINAITSFPPTEAVTVNPTDVSPSVSSEQNPVVEESQQPVALDSEPEIKSDTDVAVRETGKEISDRPVSFTSDWLEISPAIDGNVNPSSGEMKTYVAESLRSGSETGTHTVADLKPTKPAFRSRELLFPALTASRPSLFGTIVNGMAATQPIRPVLSSPRRLTAETVSRTKAEGKVERLVAVKHEAKTLPILPTAALHAAQIHPTRTAAPLQFSPLLEGPSAIDRTVLPRITTRPVPVRVFSSVSKAIHESKFQALFAFATSRTPSPIQGPNAIDLKVFPKDAPGNVPGSAPRTLSMVTHKSTARQEYDFASSHPSSRVIDGPSAIDPSVFPKIVSAPLPVSVLSTISSVKQEYDFASLHPSSRVIDGPSGTDPSVFPKIVSGPIPVSSLSTISSVKNEFELRQMLSAKTSLASSPIREGRNEIGLLAIPRRATKSPQVLPVAMSYLMVSNDAPTASITTALVPVPVLISGQTAFSQAMLKPLGGATRQSNEALSDLFAASNRGPSADSFGNGVDTRRTGSEGAKLPTAASPVLITGQPGFSTEMLKPLNPKPIQARPFNASAPIPAAPISGTSKQVDGYCDPKFVGEPIRFAQTVELRLEDLLNQLNARFGINFIVGQNVGKIPLNVKAGSIPWNILLRSQLFVSGVRARCINPNTIELVLNRDLPTLQDEGDVTSRFVKLKYLQRTSGGTVDLANRSQGGQNGGQGGCGGSGGGQSGGLQSGGLSGGGSSGGQMGQTAGQLGNNRFDQLINEIEKVVGIRSMVEGGSGGRAGNSETEEIRTNRFVTQIPGRNILVIRASDEEHELIDQIIARADRPPFQVVIKGLVYSANQDLLRDIGVQSSITGGTRNNRTNAGVLGDTLGVGTLFDFSTIIGTVDFNIQMTALQQNGVISVKSRPFATVIDGLCTTLSVGTKLPIVIDSTLGGQGGITILDADNRLAVTPYVVDDENGNPVAVTLELNLQANVIDSSITARGVPAVNSKNIQTQLLLAENKTAILGGFSIDQDSKTFSKVPGLGDIPLLGELFKRRIRDQRLSRLYFAISVDVIPYPEAIAPVVVPGATTDPQTITQEMKKRAEEAEKQDDSTKKKKKDN